MSRIESARLRWEDGVPVAEAFDDFYFNTDGGIEESQHVFLAGNQLEQRFQALASRQTFVIGETGFGTGLNFLLLGSCGCPAHQPMPNCTTWHLRNIRYL